jgi:putative MATE family efflux protein
MMRRFIANSVWLSIIISIITTIVTVALCDEILVMMKTPSDIYDYAYSYVFFILLGIPAFILFNLLAAVMRALGDSKTPLRIICIASVVSLILNIIFIVGLGFGVAGAAVATVISQLLSGVMCLFSLYRKFPVLHIEKHEWQWQAPLVFTLLSTGIPMGLQYSITAIGSVILQSAVNTLGSGAVASISAAIKVNIFFACAFDALGNAMSTYGGQHVGAGRLERLNKGLKASITIAVIYSLICFVIIWIFGRDLISLFIERGETQILDDAVLYMRVAAAFFIFLGLVNIYRFLLQGMGFGVLAIIAGVCEMLARAIAALFLVPALGFIGVCFAGPSAWILANAFLMPAYHYCKKKLMVQQKNRHSLCLER